MLINEFTLLSNLVEFWSNTILLGFGYGIPFKIE